MTLSSSLLRFAAGIALLGALALHATGCITKSCTAIYIPAVRVSVVDAATGKAVCDATVTVGDARGTDPLVPDPFVASDAGATAGCTYYGGARGGVLTITVTKPGYKTTTVNDVQVADDDCGVTKTTEVTATLTQ